MPRALPLAELEPLPSARLAAELLRDRAGTVGVQDIFDLLAAYFAGRQ